MTVTVSNFMAQLGYLLQEDGWMRNGLWSSGEIIGYINTVSKDFVLRAQMVKESFGIESVTAQRLYDDPVDSINVDRITFSGKPLYQTKRFLLDREEPAWKTKSGVPQQFHEDQLPTKTFETDRAPTSAMTGTGYIGLVYSGLGGGILRTMSGSFGYVGVVAAPGKGGVFRYSLGNVAYNANTPPSGGGLLRRMLDGATNFEVIATQLPDDVSLETENLQVPDFCVLYIKYGVLERMLAKEGEGQDLVRAQYCRARYDKGVALFQRLLTGSELPDGKKRGKS